MMAMLNSLNAHNLPIFQPILMILVSKLMVHRAFSDKTYLSLGLLSPLRKLVRIFCKTSILAIRNLAAGFGAKTFAFDVTTPCRRQLETLSTIDERGSKIDIHSVFDCHLSPMWRQMTIENSVSNDFDLRSCSSIVLAFSIAAYPVWLQ